MEHSGNSLAITRTGPGKDIGKTKEHACWVVLYSCSFNGRIILFLIGWVGRKQKHERMGWEEKQRWVGGKSRG